MENLSFKTNWQYTPYLAGEELIDGTLVNLELSDGTLFDNTQIEIEESYADVHGVKIPRKTPIALLPEGQRLKLNPKNSKLIRC